MADSSTIYGVTGANGKLGREALDLLYELKRIVKD